MVIGLFIVTAIPTVTGICQAISAQKNRDQRQKDERRMKKFNIDVHCDQEDAGAHHDIIHNGRVVVKDGRVWIGPPLIEDESGDYGYVARCMIVEYPDPERIPTALGLVSQVQSNPPLLNWIYVDSQTMELKYGNKTASIAHHVGSWDWTADEEYLTMEEVYGGTGEDFVAVKNQLTECWQIYYDREGDALESVVPESWTRVKVRLHRTLLLEGKPAA